MIQPQVIIINKPSSCVHVCVWHKSNEVRLFILADNTTLLTVFRLVMVECTAVVCRHLVDVFSQQIIWPLTVRLIPHALYSSTWIWPSLGARPSKNRKGGSSKSAGVEVYTAPGMKAHFRLAFNKLWTPSGEDRPMLVCVFSSAENSTGFTRFSN